MQMETFVENIGLLFHDLRATPPVLGMNLQIKIGWRKVKTCWFGTAKWFGPCIFAQFAEAGKMHIKA